MKIVFTLALVLLAQLLFSQAGYIITEGDTLRKGFLRYQINYENGQHEIEFWKTKTDKHPKLYRLNQIREYAIKSDTCKILKGFRYKSETIDVLEVEVIVRGKLSLYATHDLEWTVGSIPSGHGGMPVRQSLTTYILKDEGGVIKAIDRDHLEKDLPQFISDNQELMSQLAHRKIKYKKLKEVVQAYNKN